MGRLPLKLEWGAHIGREGVGPARPLTSVEAEAEGPGRRAIPTLRMKRRTRSSLGPGCAQGEPPAGRCPMPGAALPPRTVSQCGQLRLRSQQSADHHGERFLRDLLMAGPAQQLGPQLPEHVGIVAADLPKEPGGRRRACAGGSTGTKDILRTSVALSLGALGDAACVCPTMLEQLPRVQQACMYPKLPYPIYIWTTQHLEGNEFHMFTTHCLK